MTKAYSYIRFSTKEQAFGDSERRQTESSEKYLKERPELTLDTSLNMFDSGLSAFKGKHISHGALGIFLERVKDGTIESGSVLLIENIDRLSRLKPTEAYRIFDRIIHAGIKIVTLQSGMEFTEDSLNENQGQLYVIVGEIQRANQESARKSFLVGKAWEEKRRQASSNGRKITAKAPVWLKLSDDKREFETIPEVCKAIETIFKLKASGKGTASIVRIMNQMPNIWKPKPKEIKRSKATFTIGGWRKPTISKYLADKAVIGEFQPHKMIDGERKPFGDPIPDYYPAIIDKALFYQVENILKSNHNLSGNAGGKTGKATNLFTHVIKCGFCSSSMHFVDKGKGSKGGTYLHCAKARVNIIDQEKCLAKPVRYGEFMDLFFEYFDEFDIDKILPSENETVLRIKEIGKSLISIRANIAELNVKIERLIQTSAETHSDKTRMVYDKKIESMIGEKESFERSYNELEMEEKQLSNQRRELKQSIDNTKTIFALLDLAKDEQELIEIRLKIRAEIGKLFEWIKIYPLRPDEEELADLKAKRQKALITLDDKRQKGENVMGVQIHLNALEQCINDFERDENHAELIPIFKSEYIEKVRFKFKEAKTHTGVIILKSYQEIY